MMLEMIAVAVMCVCFQVRICLQLRETHQCDWWMLIICSVDLKWWHLGRKSIRIEVSHLHLIFPLMWKCYSLCGVQRETKKIISDTLRALEDLIKTCHYSGPARFPLAIWLHLEIFFFSYRSVSNSNFSSRVRCHFISLLDESLFTNSPFLASCGYKMVVENGLLISSNST